MKKSNKEGIIWSFSVFLSFCLLGFLWEGKEIEIMINLNGLFIFLGFLVAISAFLIREKEVKNHAKVLFAYSLLLFLLSLSLNFLRGLFPLTNWANVQVSEVIPLITVIYTIFIPLILLIFIFRELIKISLYYLQNIPT